MRHAAALISLSLFGMALSAALAENTASVPSYTVAKTVPLGAPDRWDFVRYDPASNRVFVSHRTQIDVVDATQGKVVGQVPGIGESHDVVTVPSLGRGYADDAAAKTVVVFDLKTLAKIASAPVGIDADAMAYDPQTKRVFVMNADGNSISAIDAVTNQSLKTVPLGGAPEMAVADGRGKLFINIASTNEIVAFDTAALAITARWPLAGCESPHGLAIDTAAHRLFVSCRNQIMQVVSSDTGKPVASLPIGKGTDSAAFDSTRKLAFSANADGTLSIVAEKGPDTYVALPSVQTVPGARTMAVDPATGRLFLVAGDVGSTAAASKPGGAARVTFVPGSLKLVVLAPSG
jgi:YVTN family beta-propeller protein